MAQPFAESDGINGVIYVGTDATTSGRAFAATVESTGTDYIGVGSTGAYDIIFEAQPGFNIASTGTAGVVTVSITQI